MRKTIPAQCVTCPINGLDGTIPMCHGCAHATIAAYQEAHQRRTGLRADEASMAVRVGSDTPAEKVPPRQPAILVTA